MRRSETGPESGPHRTPAARSRTAASWPATISHAKGVPVDSRPVGRIRRVVEVQCADPSWREQPPAVRHSDRTGGSFSVDHSRKPAGCRVPLIGGCGTRAFGQGLLAMPYRQSAAIVHALGTMP